QAAKVKSWHHHRPADHERTRFQGVVMSSTGSLRLSRKLRPIAAHLDCTHVWSVVADGAGDLVAATGEEGKVWRVSPDGKATLLYSSETGQVLSLVRGKGTVVYAGTGPAATIVRLDGSGGKVLCELKESYVWALALDPKSEAIYAATGPNGRIYKV